MLAKFLQESVLVVCLALDVEDHSIAVQSYSAPPTLPTVSSLLTGDNCEIGQQSSLHLLSDLLQKVEVKEECQIVIPVNVRIKDVKRFDDITSTKFIRCAILPAFNILSSLVAMK